MVFISIRSIFVVLNFLKKNNFKTLISERPFFMDLINEIEDEDVFLDIGAAYGVYSVYSMIKGANPVLFESDSIRLHKAAQNLELNDPQHKASFYPIALGSKDAPGMKKLDGFKSVFSRCNIVKIDVDGGELSLLKGGKSFIESLKPLIYVEAHSDELRSQVLTIFEQTQLYARS